MMIFLKKNKKTNGNICGLAQLSIYTMDFAWVSTLVNFKKRLLTSTGKLSLITGQNKGVSETKLCYHIEESPLFHTYVVFRNFPKKWASPLVLKKDQLKLMHHSFRKSKTKEINTYRKQNSFD